MRSVAATPGRPASPFSFGTQGLAVGPGGGVLHALAAERPPVTPSSAGAQVQRSLSERTAGLFAVRNDGGGNGPASSDRGSSGSNQPPPGFEATVIRRWPADTGSGGGDTGGAPGTIGAGIVRRYTDHAAMTPPPPQHEPAAEYDQAELIDRIVDAIEQRVIDELERRGRRHHPGVF
jgi:hypothetical protein